MSACFHLESVECDNCRGKRNMPNFPYYYHPPVKSCSHCYCQEIFVNNKPHLKCCNCGIQQEKLPRDTMTY